MRVEREVDPVGGGVAGGRDELTAHRPACAVASDVRVEIIPVLSHEVRRRFQEDGGEFVGAALHRNACLISSRADDPSTIGVQLSGDASIASF